MKRSSLFWGSAIVLLGAILLASNLGIVQGNVWVFFWPAIVILAGVWFLLRSTAKNEEIVTTAANVPLENATAAEITFKHGAGRLVVDANAQTGDLLSGSFAGGVTADVDRSGATAKVTLHTPSDLVFDAGFPMAGHGYEWRVGVTPQIPVTLHFETGASESRIDLSGLKASEVTLETGASSTEITTPATAGYTKMKVESGAASLKVTIPQGVGASIRVESGLASINIDKNRFTRDGDTYRSADYATAANKLDLDIETGVSSVDVH
jgi:hypothetical protein